MPAPQLEALLRSDELRTRMLGVECAGHRLRSGAPDLEGDPERWALFERSLRSGAPCVFRRSTRTALETFVRSAR